MNISPATLAAEYDRASAAWPFIADVEATYGLPPFLLYAVGSRETNLTDELGDGGHGHGVWQLDDRSHTIPDPYPVSEQAQDAAAHLAGSFRTCGSWQGACAAYNSGRCDDRYTTGGDYGADCLSRMTWLQANREETMALSDTDKTWIAQQIAASQKVITGDTESRYNDLVHRADTEVDLRKIKAELDAIKAHLGI